MFLLLASRARNKWGLLFRAENYPWLDHVIEVETVIVVYFVGIIPSSIVGLMSTAKIHFRDFRCLFCSCQIRLQIGH